MSGKGDPKHCEHCGDKAMYKVGAKGFCRGHYAEGVKAQASVMNKSKRKPAMDGAQVEARAAYWRAR